MNTILIPDEIRKDLAKSEHPWAQRAAKLTRLVSAKTLWKWLMSPVGSPEFAMGLFTAVLQEPVVHKLATEYTETITMKDIENIRVDTVPRLLNHEIGSYSTFLRAVALNPPMFADGLARRLNIIKNRILPGDDVDMADLFYAAKAAELAGVAKKNVLGMDFWNVLALYRGNACVLDAIRDYCEGNTVNATTDVLYLSRSSDFSKLAARIIYTAKADTNDLLFRAAKEPDSYSPDYEFIRELYRRVGFDNKDAQKWYVALLKYGRNRDVEQFLYRVYGDCRPRPFETEAEFEARNEGLRTFMEEYGALTPRAFGGRAVQMIWNSLGMGLFTGGDCIPGTYYAGKVFSLKTASGHNAFVELSDDALVWLAPDATMRTDKVRVLELEEDDVDGIVLSSLSSHYAVGILYPGAVVDFYDFAPSFRTTTELDGFHIKLQETEDKEEI